MADIQVGGITLSGEDYDPVDVALVWEAIQDYCGWHIAASETHTATLDVSGGRSVRLPSLHVTDVSEVLLDGADITGAVEWSQSGLIRRGYRAVWPVGFRRLKVTFTHGYDKIPAGVLAVLRNKLSQDIDGAPKQLMAGGFLMINEKDATGGAGSYSESAYIALERYRLPGLPS